MTNLINGPNFRGRSGIGFAFKDRFLSARPDIQNVNERTITHIRGAPYHPQTQGKIERYRRTIKNVINLQNYYTPEELEKDIAAFVEYYNNHRYHESINNLTPADVYCGRDEKIISMR